MIVIDIVTLEVVLMLAAAATGTGMVARALSPRALRLRKPLSCDLCTAFWSSVLVTLVWWVDAWDDCSSVVEILRVLVLAVLGSTSVAALALRLFLRIDPGTAGDELT